MFAPVTTVQFDGCLMRIHPGDNYTEYRLFLDSYPYEKKTYEKLKELVRDRNVLFYDIGANAGVYAIPVSVLSGLRSKIIAFEPNPVLLNRLITNIQINKIDKVDIAPVALGEERGQLYLNFKSGVTQDFGRATMASESAGGKSIKVNVDLLSNYIPDEHFERIVLKIDVEGYEDKVLIPFFSTTEKSAWPDYIMLEYTHSDLWNSDVRTHLSEIGYTEVEICDDNVLMRKNNG